MNTESLLLETQFFSAKAHMYNTQAKMSGNLYSIIYRSLNFSATMDFSSITLQVANTSIGISRLIRTLQ
jgi:hypothetical protein